MQQRQRIQAEHVAKLHEWVASGDPILETEAKRQLERLETLTQSGVAIGPVQLARLAASAGTTQGVGVSQHVVS